MLQFPPTFSKVPTCVFTIQIPLGCSISERIGSVVLTEKFSLGGYAFKHPCFEWEHRETWQQGERNETVLLLYVKMTA